MTPGQIKATSDLTWYFEHGIPSFERSATGPMLERAELFHVRQRRDPDLAAARRARAERIRASGCWEPCVDELTARPTRETHQCDRDEPARATLERYGRVSRRLEHIAKLDPQAARALGLAFGESGAHWSQHERGRCVALFPLVPAGRELLARAKAAKGKLDLNEAGLLRVQVVVDHLTRGRDRDRRALVLVAMREANELLTRALTLWVTGRQPPLTHITHRAPVPARRAA